MPDADSMPAARRGARGAREGEPKKRARIPEMGLAAGALIGALLPTTEHEDRVLGDAPLTLLFAVRRLVEVARRPDEPDLRREHDSQLLLE
jgi:hypothetical protein